MPIEPSFGRSRERNCTVRLFWPAIAVLMQMLGLILVLGQPAYGQLVEAESYLLDNVRVIIGDGSVLESGALLVDGGRIRAVGLRSEIELDSSVEVIDLSGKTIMPALIDSHAHLGYEGHTSWGAENYSRENLIDHLQRYAYYGFSAVFSAGSDPDVLANQVQQAQLAGEFPSARFLFAAGMAPPGQGPNDQFLTHAVALEQQTGQRILYGVDSIEQVIDSVREIAAKNISVIKIWVDDRGGSQQKLTPQLYRAINDEAAENGIEIYAHQQYAEDMPDLLEAGVSGFLHGRIGAGLGREIAQQISAANAFVVPNMGLGELRREAIGTDEFLRASLPASVVARLGESGQRLLNANREEAHEAELRASFGHLLDANVDIVLGTDAGAVPDHFFGYTGHRELEIFVRLGMTPMQAIVAATSKPAQRLGLDDLGLLQPGYSADLVVLDENPLNDIRNTRSISLVFLNGKMLDRAGLAADFRQ
ncbi:MAG: amidohydrolase family protein [Proteobacteria bacterium]|jgi:imidazolonepropionase-like amidohydrolase|nr:amidohydrolase family protein [Pseudomonadota bacterium]